VTTIVVIQKEKAMTETTRLLTIREVCDRLQLHKTALYALIERGAIPVVRTTPKGLGYLFHPEVLEEWIKAGGVKSTARQRRNQSPTSDGVTPIAGAANSIAKQS
jgi:excisionase family DNA binding protein